MSDFLFQYAQDIFRLDWQCWKRAASWQNQQNGMCTQQRLRSAWASAQSDQSSLPAWRKLRSLATHWAHCEDWSDWADAQAGLSLRWAHMPFCWFCHEVAQILLLQLLLYVPTWVKKARVSWSGSKGELHQHRLLHKNISMKMIELTSKIFKLKHFHCKRFRGKVSIVLIFQKKKKEIMSFFLHVFLSFKTVYSLVTGIKLPFPFK